VKKLNQKELETLNELIDDTVFKFLVRRQEFLIDKSMDAGQILDAVPAVLEQANELRQKTKEELTTS